MILKHDLFSPVRARSGFCFIQDKYKTKHSIFKITSNMKLTALLFAICLTGALAQTTQSPFSCFLDASISFSQESPDCAAEFSQINSVSDS